MNENRFQFRFFGDEGFKNCKVKYFRDSIQITCFSRNIFNPDKLEKNEQSKGKKKKKTKEKRERTDSIKRAKDKAFEIAHANPFEYFITITIDENKLSRTDKEEIYEKLKNFLSNLVQRKQLKYILIPEYHRRIEENNLRAIHLHGLISGEALNMVDSGKTYQGRPIYNWHDWKYGFSTAVKLDGKSHVCQYITKYITKDNEKIFGKYYLSGGKIEREVYTEYCNKDFDSIDARAYEVIPNALYVKYQRIDIKE